MPVMQDPTSPVPATLAAVVHDGRILLIRRANRPDAGRWAFPGGKVQWGEALPDAASRELLEETNVRGVARQVFAAVDVFDREYAADGKLHRHYILIAILFDWQHGEPRAGDDALDAAWFTAEELATLDLAHSFDVAALARQALQLASRPGSPA